MLHTGIWCCKQASYWGWNDISHTRLPVYRTLRYSPGYAPAPLWDFLIPFHWTTFWMELSSSSWQSQQKSLSHTVAFLNLPDDAQIKIDDKKLAISDNGADILLYWSPSAAVINDHKCSISKQHKFMLLQFWKLERWNGSAELALFNETLGDNLFPCLSWVLEAPFLGWWPCIILHHHTFSDSDLPASLLQATLQLYWAHQDYPGNFPVSRFLITFIKSLLLYK